MAEKIQNLDNSKERVALELMLQIASRDLKSTSNIQNDSPKYYLTLYNACLNAVHGGNLSECINIASSR